MILSKQGMVTLVGNKTEILADFAVIVTSVLKEYGKDKTLEAIKLRNND